MLSVSNCFIAVLTSSVLRSEPTVMSKSCEQDDAGRPAEVRHGAAKCGAMRDTHGGKLIERLRLG